MAEVLHACYAHSGDFKMPKTCCGHNCDFFALLRKRFYWKFLICFYDHQPQKMGISDQLYSLWRPRLFKVFAKQHTICHGIFFFFSHFDLAATEIYLFWHSTKYVLCIVLYCRCFIAVIIIFELLLRKILILKELTVFLHSLCTDRKL